MQSYLLSGMGGEVTYLARVGRSGIWMRAIALTMNQNSVPAAAMMATSRMAPAMSLTVTSASEEAISVSASRVCMPSTAQYFDLHMPQATTSSTPVASTVEASAPARSSSST